jgi:hypothetical protein
VLSLCWFRRFLWFRFSLGREKKGASMRPNTHPPALHNNKVRARFWFELALAVLFSGLLLFTVAVPNWIEVVFGVDPDSGSGALEWLILAMLTGVVMLTFGLARVEWRRTMRLATTAVRE